MILVIKIKMSTLQFYYHLTFKLIIWKLTNDENFRNSKNIMNFKMNLINFNSFYQDSHFPVAIVKGLIIAITKPTKIIIIIKINLNLNSDLSHSSNFKNYYCYSQPFDFNFKLFNQELFNWKSFNQELFNWK